MIRASGDALVMHVGERPYVVAKAGTLDLSTHGLNLSAMTGMLQQLLPADALVSLDEFGAVEHRLPSVGEDRFTVVAARGGDDIWIEIRRRRLGATPAAVAPAPPVVAAPSDPELQSAAASAPDAVAVVSQTTETADLLPVTAPVREAEPMPADPVETGVPVVELPDTMQANVPAEPQLESQIEPPLETPLETPVERPGDVWLETPVETFVETFVEAAAEAESASMAEPILEPEIPAEEPAAWEAEDGFEIAEADAGAALAAELSMGAYTDTTAPGPVVSVDAPMAADEFVETAPSALPVSEIETPAPPESEGVFEIAAADETASVSAAERAVELSLDADDGTAPAPESVPEVALPLASREAVESATASSPPAGPTLVIPMTRTVRIELPPRVAPHSRTSTVDRLLRLAAARGASALFLMSESRPYVRVEGDTRPIDRESLLSKADIEAVLMEIVPEDGQESVGRGEATEWIAELPELGRIRCTTFRDHRGPGVLFSMIATRAATAEQLDLAPEVQALATEAEGLVLVAGPRASGKSTLISAFVDLVNRQRAEYVITLERLIRLVHDNRAALVSQREIRGGADDALAAARAALRENPDVLVVDDLCSAQMVPLLLDAAADGLLVFVSISAPSTVDAVQRLIDLVPVESRAATQAAMAETFRGAVSQVLLKKSGGGRIAAREVLLATAPVTRLIGDGQLSQLPLALEGGRRHGMTPLTDVLVGFVQSGIVDAREAFRKTHDRERLLSALKREGVDTSAVDRLA